MSFKAKYDGHCNAQECRYGGRIQEGDECAYVDDELMHEGCAWDERQQPKRDEPVDERDGPLCGDCFTYHRGECA